MLRYAITDRRLLESSCASRVLGAPSTREEPALSEADRPSRTGKDADEWGSECEEALIGQAAALAARGDIDYLQLREKDLPPAALARLARRILEALNSNTPGAPFMHGRKDAHEWESKNPSRPRLLINSRADIAIAVRADGVHLTSSSGELTPAQVRTLYFAAGLLPPTVSVSCHTLEDVSAAHPTAPDLILFGPVFEKRIGDQLVVEGAGLELLRRACTAAAPIPVLALGGVTKENTSHCLAAGAMGVAAIRLFLNGASR